MKWVPSEVDGNKVTSLCNHLKISPRLSQWLVQRGIEDPVRAQHFLSPSLQYLEDPCTIFHMERGVACLQQALKDRKSIAMVGDYDVDGITSLALLSRCFRAFGVSYTSFLPDRETEGYGLTPALLERIRSRTRVDLLFALDCGTNSADLIRCLRSEGGEVVVIDHHRPRNGSPEGICINPHVWPERHSVSAQQLCTVGLVFKFVHAWMKYLRRKGDRRAFEFRLKPFLDLVALGTVADMVPLQNENRIFVYYGLKEFKTSTNPGIRALVKVACGDADEVTSEDISFKLAPRINASGR
ncbi:MAG: DHH family phosphoesterase [Puniceicoccales bacterium]|nr:DHH family phosphoesterase [Puniceicoccales bacterium]